jgi:hypothetical protein
VVIAGNHDVVFHREYYDKQWKRYHKQKLDVDEIARAFTAPTHFLTDQYAELACGLRVYGSPWTPEFCDWAFNLQTQEDARVCWAQIPAEERGLDILITHGPAFGHGGLCVSGDDAGTERGRELSASHRLHLHAWCVPQAAQSS